MRVSGGKELGGFEGRKTVIRKSENNLFSIERKNILK